MLNSIGFSGRKHLRTWPRRTASAQALTWISKHNFENVGLFFFEQIDSILLFLQHMLVIDNQLSSLSFFLFQFSDETTLFKSWIVHNLPFSERDPVALTRWHWESVRLSLRTICVDDFGSKPDFQIVSIDVFTGGITPAWTYSLHFWIFLYKKWICLIDTCSIEAI